mmetsp:Transcript_17435/g.23921  ORF Transcript_17435/g.23921 Transcript_17435/m.23921 type:complete len:249 (-) Transcript_17435:594-1340(-)
MTESSLSLIQGSHTRQHLALQQLKGGTATGGDVGHLISKASLFHSGHGVATTNDGGSTLASQLSEGISNVEGALGKLLKFEHTHRAVPDDGLAVRQSLLDHLGGLRAVIKAHPAIRDFFHRHNLGVGIRGESISNDHVSREDELNALLLGLGLKALGKVELVLLHKGRTSGEAAGLQESEDHTATNDDLVALRHQRLDHTNLGGHLGPTDDGSERADRVGHSAIKVVELLLEQEAGHGGRKGLGDTLG